MVVFDIPIIKQHGSKPAPIKFLGAMTIWISIHFRNGI